MRKITDKHGQFYSAELIPSQLGETISNESDVWKIPNFGF